MAVKKKSTKKKSSINDPNVLCLIISVFVIAVAGYMWHSTAYAPLMESINHLTAEKEQRETELMRINALKPQLDRLRAENTKLEAKLDSLKNIFPDQKEVPRLIRDMTAVNRRSNIVVTRFTPKDDVVKEYYVENKYDVSVTGSYHNLGELFSFLANFQLIVNLTDVSINANSAAANVGTGTEAVTTPPSVTASFELTTFSSRR